MSLSPRIRPYHRIPVNELDPHDNADEEGLNDASKRAESETSTLFWAATAVCILCTLINIVTTSFGYHYLGCGRSSYTFPSTTTFPSSTGISRDKLDTLRRPSQFIGFDKVYRNRTSSGGAKSFVNFPLLMAQVDTKNPKKVTQPSTGVWTKIGTVYPETSRMFVSSSISTLIQFRALDFGMESCELDITIPSTTNLTTFSHSTSPVQIYTIDYKRPLYLDSLSHATRPRRGPLVGEPLIKHGTVWTHRFACAMDEIYTFEVACKRTQDDCILEWIQNKEHDVFPAIRMTQYSTL